MIRTLSVLAVAALAGGLASCTSFEELSRDPMPYIESGFDNKVFPGDENTRLGRAYYVNGNYAKAEQAYRRAVEVTPQNGQAWLGLAASYDKIGRYDLSARAYRQARKLTGDNYVLLNNEGYSAMLQGDRRRASNLFRRAARLAPDNPIVANNIAVLDSGQGYFAGIAP
jgi:Flp pilus assembly protein TadD